MANKSKTSRSRRARVIKHKENCYIRSLPSELVTFVCNDLSKKDLASVRLVSKIFEQVASPFLFRSVWFSIEPRDWYNIENISKHSIFRNYVREICYDNTVYEKGLCSRKAQVDAVPTGRCSKAAIVRGYNVYRDFYDSRMDSKRFHMNKILDHPESSIASDLAKATRTGNASKLRGKPYLSEDLVYLIQAFMSMPNIDTFSLSNGRWYNCGHEWANVQISRSTKKERSFCVLPGRLPGHEQVLFDAVPAQATADGLCEVQRGFQILLQAASISQMRNLRFFNLGPVVPNNYSAQLTFLDFGMLPIQIQMARHAFCGLTNLDLRFVGHGYEHLRPEFDEEQAILRSGKVGQILHHAAGLTTLALEFGDLSRIDDLSWMLGSGAWHSLHRLTLRFMDVHSSQLANFLLLHSSSLQYLCLEDLVFREEDITNLTTGLSSHGPGSWSQFFQAITALDLGELSVARLGKNFSDMECSIWHSKDSTDIQSFLHSGGSVLFAAAGTDVVEDDDEE